MNNERTVALISAALIKAVGVINTLPPARQERSNQEDMILLLKAFFDGNYPPVGKGTVTGRDVWIACNALSYAIAVEHPDKEEMKELLEETAGGLAWAEFHMANADRHIHG